MSEYSDDAFRLRRFVERLEQAGELERIGRRVELADIAARLDGNPKAVLFEAQVQKRPSSSATSWAGGDASQWRWASSKRISCIP